MSMEKIPHYIAIARPDHWFKNVFMLPGVIFGILLTEDLPANWVLLLVIGIFSTCLIASANYVINEWLDRDFDKHHPKKKSRPSVTGNLDVRIVYLEYVSLVICGLSLA